jgi:hypothetical protein
MKRNIIKRPVLNTAACKYDVVQSCGEKSGFRIEDEDAGSMNWSIFWIDTGVSIERVLLMAQFQKINHFPGLSESLMIQACMKYAERIT